MVTFLTVLAIVFVLTLIGLNVWAVLDGCWLSWLTWTLGGGEFLLEALVGLLGSLSE